MSKQGMKRPEISNRPKNEAGPVPGLQGKAKSGKAKAKPMIAGTACGKVWHEAPISRTHGVIDTDLARDNLENDIPFADLEDL